MTAEIFGIDGLIILAIPALVVVGIVLAVRAGTRQRRRREMPPPPVED